jgi:hypothetical protein
MTITYTWSVMELNTVNTAEDPNVVVKTKWKKIGTDEKGNSGFFMGCTSFDAASVAPGTFVPFDQLTEEIVIGWIQASIATAGDLVTANTALLTANLASANTVLTNTIVTQNVDTGQNTATAITQGGGIPQNTNITAANQTIIVNEYEKHINEQIAAAIAKDAVEEPPLPWAPPAPTPPPPG